MRRVTITIEETGVGSGGSVTAYTESNTYGPSSAIEQVTQVVKAALTMWASVDEASTQPRPPMGRPRSDLTGTEGR